jgi:hypothetical protein
MLVSPFRATILALSGGRERERSDRRAFEVRAEGGLDDALSQP